MSEERCKRKKRVRKRKTETETQTKHMRVIQKKKVLGRQTAGAKP